MTVFHSFTPGVYCLSLYWFDTGRAVTSLPELDDDSVFLPPEHSPCSAPPQRHDAREQTFNVRYFCAYSGFLSCNFAAALWHKLITHLYTTQLPVCKKHVICPMAPVWLFMEINWIIECMTLPYRVMHSMLILVFSNMNISLCVLNSKHI